jgi:hypothetical protein
MKKNTLKNKALKIVVEPFYRSLTESIASTSATSLLMRKNPYLISLREDLSCKNISKLLLDAHISSSEETILGNLIEQLAISINKDKFNGYKAEEGIYVGIDLIFGKDKTKYLVSIKSGTNWGNADQKKAMKRNFEAAKELLIGDGWIGEIVLINGCIYGKSTKSIKQDANFPNSDYWVKAGKDFWNLISGEEDMNLQVLDAIDESTKIYFENNGGKYQKIYDDKLAEVAAYLADNYSNGSSSEAILDVKKYLL